MTQRKTKPKAQAATTTRADLAAAETRVEVGGATATDAELADRADAANDELVKAKVNDPRGYIGADAADLVASGNVVTTVRPGAPTLPAGK